MRCPSTNTEAGRYTHIIGRGAKISATYSLSLLSNESAESGTFERSRDTSSGVGGRRSNARSLIRRGGYPGYTPTSETESTTWSKFSLGGWHFAIIGGLRTRSTARFVG